MLVDAQPMKEFERPPDGVHDAVLVDVVDLGEKPTQFGPKRKIQYLWSLTGLDSEKKPFQVQKLMNMTMFQGSKPGQKNSGMFDASKAILGEIPKIPFETDILIGKNNQLVIENQVAPNGKTYANVVAILKPKVTLPIPAGYVRRKDKTQNTQTAQTAQTTQAQTAAPAAAPAAKAPVVEDEDIPF